MSLRTRLWATRTAPIASGGIVGFRVQVMASSISLQSSGLIRSPPWRPVSPSRGVPSDSPDLKLKILDPRSYFNIPDLINIFAW
eukprot:14981737-Alexandrium_andersonii.AAC.1